MESIILQSQVGSYYLWSSQVSYYLCSAESQQQLCNYASSASLSQQCLSGSISNIWGSWLFWRFMFIRKMCQWWCLSSLHGLVDQTWKHHTWVVVVSKRVDRNVKNVLVLLLGCRGWILEKLTFRLNTYVLHGFNTQFPANQKRVFIQIPNKLKTVKTLLKLHNLTSLSGENAN